MNQKPIEYYALTFPIPYDPTNLDANKDAVSELLGILSEIDNVKIFSTMYIQKFIDYQWNGELKKAYAVIFGLQLIMFTAIVTSACFMNTEVISIDLNDRIRMYIMIANACLTVISVGTFEVRQMLTQGTEYLNSFWNINDILVFCFAIAVAFLEIHNVRTAVYENEARMLPAKRKSSGGTGSAIEELTWNSNLIE